MTISILKKGKMPSRKAYTLVNAGRRAWGRTKATLGILVLLLFLGACLIPPPAQGAGRDQSPKELFDRGEFDRAYQEYHRLFLSDPGNPEINFSLGRAAFEAGDFEAAVMAFERVLMARPDAVRVKLEIGRCYFHLGSLEAAKRYFDEIMAVDPLPSRSGPISRNTSMPSVRPERSISYRPGSRWASISMITSTPRRQARSSRSPTCWATCFQSQWTMRRASEMVVVEHVWDVEDRNGAMKTQVKEGVFRIMGGAIAKESPQSFITVTPAATIGIRGSMFAGRVDGGRLTVVFEGGRGIDVANDASAVSITRPGFGTSIPAMGVPPESPKRFSAQDLSDLNRDLALGEQESEDGAPPLEQEDEQDRDEGDQEPSGNETGEGAGDEGTQESGETGDDCVTSFQETGGLKPRANYLFTEDPDYQFSDYFTWGYWEIACADPLSGADCHVRSPGSVWITGELTPSAVLQDLAAGGLVGEYIGKAQGSKIDTADALTRLHNGVTNIRVEFPRLP
ncbi:hypothetical protein SCFA_770033 [anaerobic digester metagenome]|jgi:hypothetical protein|uniref:Uncharacterized protein n=1 Tax=anaerobic digester metagenome TaxID=1263854 RepID=A0A485M4A2_9ZZZZ